MRAFLDRRNLAIPKTGVLLIVMLAVSAVRCGHFSFHTRVEPFAPPTGYISQQRIVLQGFSTVQTLQGPKDTVYFGYDRDKQYAMLADNSWVAVDLIEFKIIESDSSWRWEPFLIVSDDDFDGYADRLLVDADFDGCFEMIVDIRKEKEPINKMGLREISPWLLKEKPMD